MTDRSTTRRRLLACGSGVVAVGLGGCLGRRDEPPALGEPEPYAEVRAGGDDTGRDSGGTHFDRPVVHLVGGGTVSWTAEGGAHDVTAYHPATTGSRPRIPETASPWTSGRLEAGESYYRQFETEGVYDYACVRREAAGMVGSVVVGWPEPDDQPGLSPPRGDRPAAAIRALERHNDRVRTVLREAHA